MSNEKMFCCEKTKKDFEKQNYHPDLKGMKFYHMKTYCVLCGLLDYVCHFYTINNKHNDPTCYNCAKLKEKLK